jgi:hypothetical protein
VALRNYSALAVGTTITSGIDNAVTTIPVAATTGFPSVPFTMILEPDTNNEEVVLVTNVAALNLTVTRGYDSTAAVAHVITSKIQHSFTAMDFREANAFLNSGGTIGGNVTISGTLNPTNAADTATAASHYWVETASDGLIRPKTLANVKSEIVNTTTVNAAAATTVGTVTSGTWNAGVIAGQYGGTGVANTSKTITISGNVSIGSSTHTVTLTTSGNTSVALPASGTLVNDAVTALSSLATVGTITSGTWSSTITSGYLIAPEEKWNVVASNITGTIAHDYLTAQNWYYTTASTAGACTINLRGNSGTTLASLLATGDSATFTFLAATGATTPGYFGTVQVDGTVTGVTTKWQYGSAPTAGSTSSTDGYTFTVVKTAATPTYTVFASVAKFG